MIHVHVHVLAALKAFIEIGNFGGRLWAEFCQAYAGRVNGWSLCSWQGSNRYILGKSIFAISIL